MPARADPRNQAVSATHLGAQWAVKDSNSPANRDISAAVCAPVGARRARERSRMTRMGAPERDWSALYPA
jgi:hypothetical protein